MEQGIVDTDRGPVIERVDEALNQQQADRPAHKPSA
jgi:hypothetical protein